MAAVGAINESSCGFSNNLRIDSPHVLHHRSSRQLLIIHWVIFKGILIFQIVYSIPDLGIILQGRGGISQRRCEVVDPACNTILWLLVKLKSLDMGEHVRLLLVPVIRNMN